MFFSVLFTVYIVVVGIPFLLFLSLLTVSRLFLYVKLSSIDEYRLTI